MSAQWLKEGHRGWGLKSFFSISTLFSNVEELGDDLRFLGRIGPSSLLVNKIISGL